MKYKKLLHPSFWADIAFEKRPWAAVGEEVGSNWPLDSSFIVGSYIRAPARYNWTPANSWLDPLLGGFQRYLPVVRDSGAQTMTKHSLEVFELVIYGISYPFAVDYSDYPEIDDETARQVLVYFKMQFAEEGYRFENVLPGGFVTASQAIYSYLSRLRAIASGKQKQFEVYGRFGLQFASDTRRKALELLRAQRSFEFEGGAKRMRYSRYLRESASAKLVVDLPGNGALCFRLVDYLAIGCAVVGPKPKVRLPVELIDREHVAFTRDDLSDMVDICEYYLSHEEERHKLAKNARSYFDRYLSRDQLAAYYLHSLSESLRGSRAVKASEC